MSFSNQIPHDMKLVYIQRRLTDFLECNKAIETCDYFFLEKIGHQVKGNAQSFGFDALSPIAIALEKAAKEKNIEDVKKAVIDFGAAVADIQKMGI